MRNMKKFENLYSRILRYFRNRASILTHAVSHTTTSRQS